MFDFLEVWEEDLSWRKFLLEKYSRGEDLVDAYDLLARRVAEVVA
jgi:hypothetical protein